MIDGRIKVSSQAESDLRILAVGNQSRKHAADRMSAG
jgi:hypothetical protein